MAYLIDNLGEYAKRHGKYKKCLQCKKDFYDYPSGKRKFCSQSCSTTFHNLIDNPTKKSWVKEKIGRKHRGIKKPKLSETRKRMFREGKLTSPCIYRTEETFRKISKTRKHLFKEGKLIHPRGMLGKIPWNKNKKCSQLSEENQANYIKIPKEVLYQKYVAEKKTVEEVSKELNMNRNVVYRRIKKYGYLRSNSEAKKLSLSLHPERHWNWQGGISFEPYSPEFNNILKLQIRMRDIFACQLCGLKESGIALDVHHINFNKKNNVPNNLISLCKKCHGIANKKRNPQFINFIGQILS